MGKRIFPETDPGCAFTAVAPLAILIAIVVALFKNKE